MMDTSDDRAGNSQGRRAITRTGIVIALVPVTLAAIVTGVLVIWIAFFKEAKRPEVVQPEPVNVEVMEVAAEPKLVDSMELPAVVEPDRVVQISAEVAGRIERLALEEGTPLEAGETIAVLNTDILKADFDRASAQATYDQTNHRRVTELHKRGAATEAELDSASAAVAASRAAVQAARARLDRARIIAPTSGMLDDLGVEKGEYVMPGTPVAKIVDTSTVKVVVDVPEKEVGYLKAGDAVDVLASGSAVRRLSGVVTYISAMADGATHSTRVEVSVDNAERLLRSGKIVNVRMTRRVLADVIMVPLAAIIPLEDGRAAYVVEGGTARERDISGRTVSFIEGGIARRRRVKIDASVIRKRSVRVLSGLSPGDRLIVAGQKLVGPGQTVTFKAED